MARRTLVARCALPLMLLPSALSAAETSTFVYDPLGRLISTSNAGGPRGGKAASTDYDPAGNRVTHAVGVPPPPPDNSVQFSILSPTSNVNEGETAYLTIAKSRPSTNSLSVTYGTANGTAVAPGDYTATTGSVTFLPSETAKAVSVPVALDSLAEPVEQFTVSLLSSPPGSSISPSPAQVTINASSAPNQPPVAQPNSITVGICLSGDVNVVANDSDPEGNTPLVVTAVTASTIADVYVASSTTISVAAYGAPGTGQVTYTVRDNLGATSTGVLTLNIVNGSGCN